MNNAVIYTIHYGDVVTTQVVVIVVCRLCNYVDKRQRNVSNHSDKHGKHILHAGYNKPQKSTLNISAILHIIEDAEF